MANNFFAGQESLADKFKSVLPFRGQLADVREANNDPEAIVGLANLGWEARKQPLFLSREVPGEDGQPPQVTRQPWPSGNGQKRDCSGRGPLSGD